MDACRVVQFAWMRMRRLARLAAATHTMVRTLGWAAALATAVVAVPAHAAEDWPKARPVRIVVPFPAGQGADIIARLIAERLSPAIGQSIIVENRPGAGSMIGSAYVARAEPDGYTLLAAGSSALTINPFLYTNLSYDPAKDFAPIIDLVQIDYMMVANARLHAGNLAELLKAARDHPGKITYGSSGLGSTNQLTTAQFEAINHLKLVHVPYKGAAASMNDLLSGQIDLLVESVAVIKPFLKSDQVRVIGMTGIKRSPLLPDVPTLAEQGLKGFDFGTWTGLVAPAGTPAPILDKLNAATARILRDPEVRQRIEAIGMVPVGGSRQQFSNYVKSEMDKWRDVVKTTGTRLDSNG
jgi:tripartite-type tricarboxylate transporter receptor subunit TctC